MEKYNILQTCNRNLLLISMAMRMSLEVLSKNLVILNTEKLVRKRNMISVKSFLYSESFYCLVFFLNKF